MTDEASIVEQLRDGLDVLRALEAQGGITEADTRQHLIDPVTGWLGYESRHVRRELLDRGNRPDYVLYARPLTEGGPAQVIVEAKPLDTDFDRIVLSDRTETPDRQARRYLRDHAASGAATMGALTDGLRWRLYVKERDGRIVTSDELDLGWLARHEDQLEASFGRLRDSLARKSTRFARGASGERALQALAVAVADNNAEEALVVLGAKTAPLEPLAPEVMTGRDRDQAIEDWISHTPCPRSGDQAKRGRPSTARTTARTRGSGPLRTPRRGHRPTGCCALRTRVRRPVPRGARDGARMAVRTRWPRNSAIGCRERAQGCHDATIRPRPSAPRRTQGD